MRKIFYVFALVGFFVMGATGLAFAAGAGVQAVSNNSDSIGLVGAVVVEFVSTVTKGLIPPEFLLMVLGLILTRFAQFVLGRLQTRKKTVIARLFWRVMRLLFGKMVELQYDLSWMDEPDHVTRDKIKDLKNKFPILNIDVPRGEPPKKYPTL